MPTVADLVTAADPVAAGTVPGITAALRRAAQTGPRRDLATLALTRITGDRRYAETYLDQHAGSWRAGWRVAPAMLAWLVEHGGLADRHEAQLDERFAHPMSAQSMTAWAMWRLRGPAAAPALLRELPRYLDDDGYARGVFPALADMGRHAAPLLPLLDAAIDRPTRRSFNVPTADDAMYQDEILLERASETRAAILADLPPMADG